MELHSALGVKGTHTDMLQQLMRRSIRGGGRQAVPDGRRYVHTGVSSEVTGSAQVAHKTNVPETRARLTAQRTRVQNFAPLVDMIRAGGTFNFHGTGRKITRSMYLSSGRSSEASPLLRRTGAPT